MYIDDPSEMIRHAEAKWLEYIQLGDELIQQVEATVVEWRFADWWSNYYLPDHPFWRMFDTSDSCGPWTPRPMKWIGEKDADVIARHGFDSQGRIVVAKVPRDTSVVVFGDGYYDILNKFPKLDVGVHPSWNEKPGDGVLLGGFERFFVDGKGRITGSLRIHNERLHPQCHYRMIELFRWEEERLVESYQQSFSYGADLPPRIQRNPPEDTDALYRRINEEFREHRYSRRRVEYGYGKGGEIAKADVHYGYTEGRIHDGKYEQTLFARKSSDSIEKVIQELVPQLAKAIVKLVKETKGAQPVRRVALLYLSEHAHCGLPTFVRLLGVDDIIQGPVLDDPYPHLTSWPSGQSKKIGSCLTRLMSLVEGNSQFADEVAPRPYREVLWKASRMIYDELAGKRKVVADDFAVFPVDQHSDADAAEDIRESLPADVAERVIREMATS
jgi:hypothetical protein